MFPRAIWQITLAGSTRRFVIHSRTRATRTQNNPRKGETLTGSESADGLRNLALGIDGENPRLWHADMQVGLLVRVSIPEAAVEPHRACRNSNGLSRI